MNNVIAIILMLCWFILGIIIERRKLLFPKTVVRIKCKKCGAEIRVEKKLLDKALEDIKLCPKCGERFSYRKENEND